MRRGPGARIRQFATRFSGMPADSSRALFRTYWLVVGPFSGAVRKEWLRAIERRARAGACAARNDGEIP